VSGAALGALIAALDRHERPLVVLLHDAWFDGSSWNDVMSRLQGHGVDVLALSNPLQSLAGDGAVLQRVLAAQAGPAILVGHGWGGTVITQAGATGKVPGLVYVAGLAPDRGESVRSLRACDPEPGGPSRTRADADGYIHFEQAGFPTIWHMTCRWCMPGYWRRWTHRFTRTHWRGH
jgi:pimeloyl-ACP methyl ester carboxylesterase